VPVAYSYIRFSTPDQIKGDSLRRQTEASHRYAAENNLTLDETLNIRDLGVSALHLTHIY
jgi:DNA invertase Pin-like site-specific DNA recombinase